MTPQERQEMTEQMTKVTIALKQLLEIAAWLEAHRDVKGSDPYLGPTDLAYYIRRACEQLSFAAGQFIAFVCPSGSLGDLIAKNAKGEKETR